MEKIPAKEFARAMGNNAVYLYSRLSKRVESNRVINRLFQKGLAGDSDQQRVSYLQMAANYEQLQQYTNAANMYQRARQIRDDADAIYKQAMNVYNGKTNPGRPSRCLISSNRNSRRMNESGRCSNMWHCNITTP